MILKRKEWTEHRCEYSIGKYCCVQMKELMSQFQTPLTLNTADGNIYIRVQSSPSESFYQPIRYCPFCGELII